MTSQVVAEQESAGREKFTVFEVSRRGVVAIRDSRLSESRLICSVSVVLTPAILSDFSISRIF